MVVTENALIHLSFKTWALAQLKMNYHVLEKPRFEIT